MGWWNSEHGICGDGLADLIGHFFDDLEDLFLHHIGRLPTQGEVADLIEFSTCGILKPVFADADFPFSKVTAGDDDTPRVARIGRQGAHGDAARPPDGHMVNVNPETSKHYPDSEMDKVIEDQTKEAKERGISAYGTDAELNDGD